MEVVRPGCSVRQRKSHQGQQDRWGCWLTGSPKQSSSKKPNSAQQTNVPKTLPADSAGFDDPTPAPPVSRKAKPIFIRRTFGPEDCADRVSVAAATLTRIRKQRRELLLSMSESSLDELAAALRVFEASTQKDVSLTQLEDWHEVAKRCYGSALDDFRGSNQGRIDAPVRVLLLVEEEKSTRTQLTMESNQIAGKNETDRREALYITLVDKYNALVRDYNSMLQSAQQYYVLDMQFHSLVQSYFSRPVVVPTFPILPPPQQSIYCSSNSWPGGMTFTTCH